jgi:hypothetical protein
MGVGVGVCVFGWCVYIYLSFEFEHLGVFET